VATTSRAPLFDLECAVLREASISGHSTPTGTERRGEFTRFGANNAVVGSRAGAVVRKVVVLSVSRVSPFVPV
jgi:hypothetical protein